MVNTGIRKYKKHVIKIAKIVSDYIKHIKEYEACSELESHEE